MPYYLKMQSPFSFDRTVENLKEQLGKKGFKPVAIIDMAEKLAVLKNEPQSPYVILGFCNPAIATEVLQVEPAIGVLLPCNVIVRQDKDNVIIEAVDPVALMRLARNEVLVGSAEKVKVLFEEALRELRSMH